jgi:hypothetical protein
MQVKQGGHSTVFEPSALVNWPSLAVRQEDLDDRRVKNSKYRHAPHRPPTALSLQVAATRDVGQSLASYSLC